MSSEDHPGTLRKLFVIVIGVLVPLILRATFPEFAAWLASLVERIPWWVFLVIVLPWPLYVLLLRVRKSKVAERDWICPRCGGSNSGSSGACGNCGTLHPTRSWHCEVCDTLNAFDVVTCMKCSAPPPKPDPETVLPFES